MNANTLAVTYELTLEPGISPQRFARGICLEQTVELSDDLVIDPQIRERVVGQIRALEHVGGQKHHLVVDYNWDVVGREIPQFLNVIYGNISLKRGIKVLDIDGMQPLFEGPRWGVEGVRKRCGITDRPLLCTALKPLGSSTDVLASIAYDLAFGGLNIIKDDHGLSDQSSAPFRERTERVFRAIEKANSESGNRCLYLPNFAPGVGQFHKRLKFCQQLGIEGLMVSPFLIGFDSLAYLRSKTDLILMAHPAFSGSFFVDPNHGFRPGLVLGKLVRMAGADASIYPNVGGRFVFDLGTCKDINRELRSPVDGVRPAFPVPAGGMSLDHIGKMRRLYGEDLVLLIGGALFREDPDLKKAARRFRHLAHQVLPAAKE